jgi:hypothetical protein
LRTNNYRLNVQPVRPVFSRAFSTSNKQQQKDQIYSEDYQEKKKQTSGNKFLEFIKKIDTIDATQETKTDATQADYNLDELDIGFEKIARPQDLSTSKPTEAGQAPVETVLQAPSEQALIEERVRNERDKLIFEAKRRFNHNFFKNFAFAGADSAELTQKSLEEFIINLENPMDI